MDFIRTLTIWVLLGLSTALAAPGLAAPSALQALLELESATSPQVSPDGGHLVYTRWRVDWLADKRVGELWLEDLRSGSKTLIGEARDARFSPSGAAAGSQLAYFAAQPDGATGLVLRPVEEPEQARALLTLPGYPRDLQWSPDGRLISFRMGVPGTDSGWPIDLPAPPEGATWAPPPHVIKKLHYRLDGLGYHYMGYEHLFVASVETGELRQVTNGNWHVGAKPAGFDLATSSSWSADSREIYFDGVASEDYDVSYGRSNIYRVTVESGAVSEVELPPGFWINPTVSPDGESIAFAGFAHGERIASYTARDLWFSRTDGTRRRKISADLDRDAEALMWAPDGSGVYFSADHSGTRQVFFASREAEVRQLTQGNHAVYPGNFDRTGTAVASLSLPNRPAGIVSFDLQDFNGFTERTDLNQQLLARAPIGEVEELRFHSPDGTALQGWLLKPADFDPAKRYPVILEIHGGPHEMYHWGWSTYFQALAAQGFLVVYSNPRGSSGYGTAFGNAIDNDFPGRKDREDLMAAVDAVAARGYADAESLFVTGCSAGGTLTLWLIAHSPRFKAAAANCVISNFLGYAGTADVADWSLHRFNVPFWENPGPWLDHSPLMKAGAINTPTLLMTGEQDLRTPIAQAEQVFSALASRGVPTRLVRFPTEAHGTTRAPSNFMRTVLYITDWFRQWQDVGTGDSESGQISPPAREGARD